MSSQKVFNKVFRQTFNYGTKDLTHYFPGHMAKGLLQMQSKLKTVDCILEVHDARIPYSGRNPRFDEVIKLRPHILILNKIDLAHLPDKKLLEVKLREEGIKEIVYANCKDQFTHTVKTVLPGILLQLLESSERYHRESAEDYNLLVIGIPNVGKSSLINALRRTHIGKGKATKVGAEAGITRSVMERIKIIDNPPIYLYDSPGILNPRVTDLETGMKLALCATMKDSIVGEDVIADYMLFWLNKHGLFKYVEYFGLGEPTDNIYDLLNHVAMEKKLIQKRKTTIGKYVFRPDFHGAAKIVLKAFREGKLGKVNLDVDLIPKS